MGLEIEAKVKVAGLDAISERLEGLGGLGAEHRGDVTHLDTYYAGGIKRGCGLRLRRWIDAAGEKAILTYKGTRQKGRFKKRTEIEVEIADYSAMAELLEALGYRQELIIEKRRRFWRFRGCAICLDQLPLLGSFVEVEGPAEDIIGQVLAAIGLGGLEHINKGYAGLMKSKLREIGSQDTQVLFDSEG
ncbi:MAG: class IV adenylate cyclase [Planctomycetota bacterium]|nr:MAG: class IV adenylate cyclase [Planctomycetota bacterium]